MNYSNCISETSRTTQESKVIFFQKSLSPHCPKLTNILGNLPILDDKDCLRSPKSGFALRFETATDENPVLGRHIVKSYSTVLLHQSSMVFLPTYIYM